MRLYTIQPPQLYRQLRHRGYLRGHAPSVHAFWDDPGFRRAYQWIRTQMAQRIPGYRGSYPVWFWVNRPDLRTIRWAPKNSVLLTVEVPEELILISNFEAWHCVLNNCFLPRTQKEERLQTAREARLGRDHPQVQAHIRRSWERIFDPQLTKTPYWRGSSCLQAVVETLKWTQVVEIKKFNKSR